MALNNGRDCLRGHGPMMRQDGLFGVPQFEREAANKITEVLSPGAGTSLIGTGRVFAGVVFICSTCGYLEMVDEEKASWHS